MDPSKGIFVKDKYIFVIFCNTVTLIPNFGGLRAVMPCVKWWHVSHDAATRLKIRTGFPSEEQSPYSDSITQIIKKRRSGVYFIRLTVAEVSPPTAPVLIPGGE